MPAKFITAPDKIKQSTNKKILIIDADWHEIEPLALLAMTRTVDIDFYIFAPTSILTDWIDEAIELADTILLNTNSTRRDLNNYQLLSDPRTTVFGDRKSSYPTPLDYIVKTLEENQE